jgi:hypothetical protein
MTLSLPTYDVAITRLIRDVKRGFEKLDPILGKIEVVPVKHGGKTRQVSEPELLDTKMRKASVEAIIQLDWYRYTDIESFSAFLWDSCQDFNSQAKKHLFEVVSQTTEAVGNVVNAEGKNAWDAQIEMMGRTEMRFDEDGNHGYEFYLHPDTAKKIPPPTPEQKQRWEDTIRAKREEYYAKKRTRRLS